MATFPIASLRDLQNYGSVTRHVPESLAEDGPAKDEVTDFLDGGLAAWLTVFGAFLALFCSFGQMNAFGTYQSWYTTHQLQDMHPSTVAWIGSVQLWVFFFSVRALSDRPRVYRPPFSPAFALQGGFIGRMFDMYGPRAIMALGTTVYVASILLTSIACSYPQYIVAQGVLSGLGVGMLCVAPLLRTSPHRPDQHRAARTDSTRRWHRYPPTSTSTERPRSGLRWLAPA